MTSPPTGTLNDDREPTGASGRGAPLDGTATQTSPSPATEGITPTSATPPSAAATGRLPQIPGYVVVRRIGGGGMGEVYEAINRLDRRVALKLIRPDRDDPEFLIRFRKEAAALQDLDHPNVARIFEYNEYAGVPFFTMRLLTGGTLAERLDEFRAEPRRAVELMATVAGAVGYVHGRNLLHRDLKPSNILFDDEKRPFVSDFGLVKDLHGSPPAANPTEAGAAALEGLAGLGLLDSSAASPGTPPGLTVSGRAVGTLPYMAPEQVRADPNRVGPSTDVWALGVILYEVLTGRRPFSGEDASTLRSSIETAPPPPPGDLNPSVDGELAGLLVRCLAKRPEDRPATADDLAAELRAWLSRAPSRPASRRRSALLVLGLGVVLTGLAAGVYFAWPPRADPEQQLRHQLAEGKSQHLLVPGRLPDYSRVLYGPVGGQPYYVNKDGSLTVETQDLVVLELVPPGCCPQGYHLQAQVRFDQGEPGVGRGGLYIGHTSRRVGEEEFQFFAEWGFTDDTGALVPDDLPPLGPGQAWGHYAMVLRRSPELPPRPRVYFSGSVREADAFYSHPADPGGQWRDLEVEVTPQHILLKWEGEVLGPVPADALTRASKAYFQKMVQPPPEFTATGGVGLVVYKASMSFRSATIRPLPSDSPIKPD